MKRLFVFVPLLLIVIVSCEDIGTPSNTVRLGMFNYIAFDTMKNPIVHGTLTLVAETTAVSGSWEFEGGESGKLVGSWEGETLILNLNPQFIDNNLFLMGKFNGRIYAGQWQQIGFPGVMAQGTFVATLD